MTDTSAKSVRRYLRRLALPAAEKQGSDAELLARFVARRDEAAFTALVTRHGPLVQRVCRRVLSDSSAADDAFQATFLVLARKAGSIGRRDLLANWLYGVAYRVAARARSDAARRKAREAQAALRHTGDPLEEISARELCVALDEELLRLPERFRLPLLLCCVEGQTRDEAARQLNWSVRTISRRLEAGRELLRGRLSRRGVALPAALLAGAVAAPASSASVTNAMVAATVEVGCAAPTAVPASIASLADAVIGARAFSKRVVALVLLLALGAATTATALTYYTRGDSKPENPPMRPEPTVVDSTKDPLPVGAKVRFGSTRWRHQHTIVSVSFSGDGSLLASGSWDETVRIWDFATGRELRKFSTHPERNPGDGSAVSSVALSPDGKLLAVGDQNCTLVVFDVETGQERFRAEKMENTVIGASFSPDGRQLAATSCGAVRIWDAKTWNQLWQFGVRSGGVRKLAYSRDSAKIATLNENGLVDVIEVKTGKVLDHFDGAKLRALFLPDNKTIVTTIDHGKVSLRDTQLHKEIRQVRPEVGGAGIIALSPDGKLLAYAKDSLTIHLIDVATGKTLRTCRWFGEDEGIADVKFSPDGKRLVSVAHQMMMHVWDVATATEIPPPAGHIAAVKRIALSRNGRDLISAGEDGRLIVWNRATGDAKRLDEVATKAGDIAIAHDGRIVALAVKDQICVWDLTTHKKKCELKGHAGEVNSVAISPDEKTIASASWHDHTIRLWNAVDGTERLKINLPAPNGVNYGDCPIVFTPDGKTMISGSADRANRVIYYWDVATGKQIRVVKQQVSKLVLSPDGRLLASTGWDGEVCVWDVAAAKELRHWKAGTGALAFSRDGRLLATGGVSGDVQVWELSTGRERCRFLGHRPGGFERRSFAAGVSALVFSRDGRTLYSGGGDSTILAWDLFGLTQVAGDLNQAWADLASDHGEKAHAAIGQFLSRGKGAVSFLTSHLKPTPSADAKQVARFLGQLDSPNFATRERAMHALEKMGESILPFVTERQMVGLSAEARNRLQAIRERIEAPLPRAEIRRGLRAVEILESIGSPEARELLRMLAAGSASRQTREAKASVARLQQPK